MTPERMQELVLAISNQRIVCLGDVMLDQYIYGRVLRISPEAPVPVLAQTDEMQMPGGAANTARNLAALGVRTRLISMIGDDEAGRRLKALLAAEPGIDAHLFVDPDSSTTSKTRLVSSGQQLLRLDKDSTTAAAPSIEREILATLPEACDGATAILISDYAKGFVSPDIIAGILKAGLDLSIPIIVDPKGKNIARYGPVDLIKPNAAELAYIVDMPTDTDTEIAAALHAALELSAAKAIIVTRAAKGLSYLERGAEVVHKRGVELDVFDVSGAGDTSLAALGASISEGADFDEATELALMASQIAVGKPGTATVTSVELLAARDTSVLDLSGLKGRIVTWRQSGHSVGFTNGCFDILHPGHLKVLEEAKARCGRLIVGLNSDASVRRLKGESRPVNNEQARAQVLASLSAVDAVIVFDQDTPLELIQSLQPDVLVKGGDYTEAEIVGADFVKARGGKVHIVPLLEGHSTTSTIARAALDPENSD